MKGSFHHDLESFTFFIGYKSDDKIAHTFHSTYGFYLTRYKMDQIINYKIHEQIPV